MKKDLVTVIIAAIIGFIGAYFVTNLLYPAPENVQVRTIDDTVDSSIAMPSEDIFNFRSINPTVEVYVGQCKEYNSNGDCIDGTSGEAKDEDEENAEGESTSEATEESGDGNAN